jgi:hypothetical protein
VITGEDIIKLIKMTFSQSLKVLISVVLVVLIVLFELSLPNNGFIHSSPSSIQVLDNSVNSIFIQYDLNEKATKFVSQSRKAPKVILTNSQAGGLKLFDSTYMGLGQNTSLNTLIFMKNRYHGVLNKGQLILDTKTSSSNVTIQVGNASIRPYLNGLYYLSVIENEITIQVLNGNAELQIYSDSGELKRKIILSKYNQVKTFDSFAVEGDIKIEKPVKDNDFYTEISELIPSNQEKITSDAVFTLNYKGQTIKPSTNNKLGSVFSSMSFNQKRKDYYSISPFYIELNNLIQKSLKLPVSEQDTLKLNEIYLKEIANNINALKVFRVTLQEKYAYILSVNPDENLYQLKLYLLQYFNSLPSAIIILSELDDLYVLYPDEKLVQTNAIFDHLKLITQDIGKADAQNILAILDNLAETTIQSNTRDLFELRNDISTKLTTTIEKAQFRVNTQQHLLRLQSAHESQQLSSLQVKGAVESLLSTLDATSQSSYEQFLLSLN